MNSRQRQILDLLNSHDLLSTRDLLRPLKITRARLNQLIVPLMKKGLVKREGRARATIYKITDKRSFEQITRKNWELRNRIRELEKTLEDRRVIEQAKEILIAQFDILPTEAYRKLQEQSMDRGRSMREIADGILLAYEF
ncbi:MAG: ANTAR domain-containing protein [Candidatus Saganbacteria bacterium]|nr:ANTAR domain-containing protein [Candidatus Saganbacteria bacterium]